MFFQYGGYTHPANEAKVMAFIVRPELTPRGVRWCSTVEMHVQIEIVVAPNLNLDTAGAQAYLNNRIIEIIAAYKDDYQDATFYHDDGTPTRHRMTNADSFTGVRIRHRTWPRSDAGEYATTRTGYVVLEAKYKDLYSEIWSFQEQVRSVGTGGKRWRAQELVTGLPIATQLNQFTVQRVVQAGSAVGIDGYPLTMISPLLPLQFEHEDMREFSPGTAQANGQGFTHYPCSWAFHYTLPSPLAGNYFPISR